MQCVSITPCPAAVLRCCARQRLPDQVLLLLQQAGVSRTAAAEALAQFAITVDVPNSSSSSSGDNHADEASASQSSDSSSSSNGIGQARKLFGQSVPAAQPFCHPALQRPQQQQQQGPMAVLNRLQTRQLVQVLEDCQAPTFGDKQVLLQRLVLLLQEQWSLQDAHSRQQQQPQPQDDQQEQYGTHTVLQSMDESQQQQPRQQQQQQQQQRQQKGQQPVSRQLPEIAAQQALLQSVLNVQQIGRWLLAARAQDVCIVDVRWGLKK